MYNPSNYHPGQEIKHYQYPSEAPMSFLITILSPPLELTKNLTFKLITFLLSLQFYYLFMHLKYYGLVLPGLYLVFVFVVEIYINGTIQLNILLGSAFCTQNHVCKCSYNQFHCCIVYIYCMYSIVAELYEVTTNCLSIPLFGVIIDNATMDVLSYVSW